MKIGSFQVSADVDQSREEKTFADLSPEEREKCRRFWVKFRILERGGWALFLAPPLLHWAFPAIALRMPRAFLPTVYLLWLASLVWLFSLYCPRCGAKFSGGLLAMLPAKPGPFLRYPSTCYGCELTRRELKYISEHAG